jgi:hypothetical protein
MGRVRVVWIINSELYGGSHRPCRLRTSSVGSKRTSFDYVLAHTGFLESHKLSSFVCH